MVYYMSVNCNTLLCYVTVVDFVLQLVTTVVQQLTRFQLTYLNVCDNRASFLHSYPVLSVLLKLILTATPDMTKLCCLCLVCFVGLNWIPDNSRLSPAENLKSEHINTLITIVQFTPPCQTRLFYRVLCGGVN